MAALPNSLKPIQSVLSVSKQFSKKDPIVSYYCLLYAVQQGITLGKGDEAAKGTLLKLMDEMGVMKKTLKNEEAFTDEIVGQSHVEEIALQIFNKADQADRSGVFDKNVIKLFFVSSQLFTVLDQFGEQTDEIEYKKKYAKWKAVEIDRCLKAGITPTPGPAGGFPDEDEVGGVGGEESGRIGEPMPPPQPPSYGFNIPPPGNAPYPGAQPVFPGQPGPTPTPLPRTNIPPRPNPTPPTNPPTNPTLLTNRTPPTFTTPPSVAASVPSSTTPLPSGGVAQLSGTQKDQVQKYCKYAISALDFNDSKGAIDFLEKSLRLLRTGKEN